MRVHTFQKIAQQDEYVLHDIGAPACGLENTRVTWFSDEKYPVAIQIVLDDLLSLLFSDLVNGPDLS